MADSVADLYVEALISHSNQDYPQAVPKYPFINGLICLLFIFLALGAVLDPTPQDITPKITGSLALAIAAGSLWHFTTPEHSSRHQRTTWVLVIASGLLIPLIWFVR